MALSPTSSRGSSGGAGALTLLSTTTLGADGVFDITGISGAYNDLLITAILSGAAAAASTTALLTFNGDAGSNYDFQHIQATGATVGGSQGVAGANIQFTYAVPAGTATVNRFAHIAVEILGYASTTWMKQVLCSYGGDLVGSSAYYRAITAGQWRSTAAINRIQLSCTGATNFFAGSQIRIYGRL